MNFIVDFMLGKLARNLRLIGFDTIYVRCEDRKQIFSTALKENRILLTRSHLFPVHKNVFIINSEDVKEQIVEVVNNFSLKDSIAPFTRCLLCNTPLKPVEKEQVKGKVPLYIYETQNEFVYCSLCSKFYWKGTHYTNMKKEIEKLKSNFLKKIS